MSQSTNICKVHRKPIEFACLDKECFKTSYSCLACVVQNHADCSDESLVDSSSLFTNLQFAPTADIDALNTEFTQIVNKNIKTFDDDLKNLEKNLSLVLKEEESEENKVYVIKNHYSHKEENGVVSVIPLLQNNTNNLDKAYKEFRKTLEQTMDCFKANVNNLSLDIVGSLSANKFNCHKFINAEDKNGAVSLTRTNASIEFNYFSAIYTEPINEKSRFTFEITGIYAPDPFLDIGVINKKKMEKHPKDPIISFASSTISYCGTSVSGLTGSYSGYRHKVGNVLTLDIDPSNKKMTMVSKCGKVNLSHKSLPTDTQYYLFVTLYHKDASCIVKKEQS